MKRASLVALLCLFAWSAAAAAQDREVLGWGRLFTNDVIGDNKDRWRTGSYVLSRVVGPHWTGHRPARVGSLLEFRFRNETISPASVDNPDPGDRRYASIFAAGVHTHFERGGVEVSLGGDLYFVGPQTGGGRFQKVIHDLLNQPDPANALDAQIPNLYRPTALIELGRPFHLSPRLKIRPFVEAQAGVETFARIGGDLHFGLVGQNDFWMRDVTTGHLYRAGNHDGANRRFAGVLGADIAYVADSAYLPEDLGYDLTETRYRVRAGVHWQGKRSSVFYGVTYLGPEFERQPNGQVVGSMRLHLRF